MEGRCWVIYKDHRRCLFQVKDGRLVYRVTLGKKFPHSDRPEHEDLELDSRVSVDGDELVIRLPIHRRSLRTP